MGSSVRPSEIPSVRRQNETGNFWTQLLLHFLKLCRYFCHGLKMCLCVWGYPPIIFHQFFPVFRLFFSFFFFFFFFFFFSCQITIRIDTLCAQLFKRFPPIILKLCILVLHRLKMYMWFWGYPPIINLFHFFDFFYVRLVLE